MSASNILKLPIFNHCFTCQRIFLVNVFETVQKYFLLVKSKKASQAHFYMYVVAKLTKLLLDKKIENV